LPNAECADAADDVGGVLEVDDVDDDAGEDDREEDDDDCERSIDDCRLSMVAGEKDARLGKRGVEGFDDDDDDDEEEDDDT
jgi:hypothetical protein